MQSNFFPPYLRKAAKIYVATSHSVVRQETIEISEQRTAFVWFFAQEVDWCMNYCDKQRLQTTVSINLWKILAAHTGDRFDVKTASICTTQLWDVLKSVVLTSLNFKVAPYPIIVSLDTLRRFAAVSPFCFGYPAQPDIASWPILIIHNHFDRPTLLSLPNLSKSYRFWKFIETAANLLKWPIQTCKDGGTGRTPDLRGRKP